MSKRDNRINALVSSGAELLDRGFSLWRTERSWFEKAGHVYISEMALKLIVSTVTT